MAIAFVSKRGQPSSSTQTQVYKPNATVVAGATLFICGKVSGGATITSVTDSQNNTWTVDVQAGPTQAEAFLLRGEITTALTTTDSITVVYSSAQSASVMLLEFSGGPFTIDQTAKTVQGTSTSISVGPTATTTQANELWIAVGASGSSGVWTPSAGWTNESPTSSAADGEAYQIVSAIGAASVTLTNTVSNNMSAVLATYYVAAGGSTYTDSPSGSVAAGGSATEDKVGADAQTGTVTPAGSSTDARIGHDTRSGIWTPSGSLTDAKVGHDLSSGAPTVSGSLLEAYGHIFADLVAGTVAPGGSITDHRSLVNVVSGGPLPSGAALDARIAHDLVSGALTAVGHVVEAYILPFTGAVLLVAFDGSLLSLPATDVSVLALLGVDAPLLSFSVEEA